MKKLNLVNKFLMLFIMICLLAFTGCKKETENKDDDNKQDVIPETPTVEIINEHTTFNILEGTIYETTVHKFKSNIEGPKVAIVGGIHGDEVAGWKAALELVKRDNFKGEVLIIPQAHILADTLVHRYPGFKYDGITTSKEHNGIKYEDLNRIFGKTKNNPTQTIANAIIEVVTEFKPEYIIDLHESRRSSTADSALLGDLVIFGNSYSALFADDLVYEFNARCIKPYETKFGTDTNAPEGSFNNYFGTKFPKSIVFTIETNREFVGGKDTADLSRRIEQQLQLIDLCFELMYE